MASAGDVQVGGALRQERRWGEVATKIEKYNKKNADGAVVGWRREIERSRKTV